MIKDCLGMLPRAVSIFFKTLDKRFKVMLVATGLYNWTSSLSRQYDQLYATDLGANPIELGSLNSLGSLVNAVISAPMGWFIDRYGVKKLIILGLSFSAIVSGIYGCAFTWWMLIPAIILSQVSMRLIMPLTDIIIIGTTESKSRSLAMGFSRSIWAIPNLFSPMVAAMIVSQFGGINTRGIRPLYFVQLSTFLFVIVFVSFMLEPLQAYFDAKNLESEDDSRKNSIIEGFKEVLRSEKRLKYWMAIMGLWRFGISMIMPFVPLWLVQVKHADPYMLGILGTISTATSILLQIPAGRLADKIGRKKVFLMLRPFTYLGILLMIWAQDPITLIIAGAFGVIGLGGMGGGGGIGGVSFIPFITMYWESVSSKRRGRLFGLTGIFGVFAVLASILGGALWQAGYMELVLILPILIEIMIVIPLLIRIPENFPSDK